MGPVRRTTGTPLPSLAWLPLRTITFQQAVPLRMRLVRFGYTMGTPPVTHEPSATDVDSGSSHGSAGRTPLLGLS